MKQREMIDVCVNEQIRAGVEIGISYVQRIGYPIPELS
jgi:hypothetical protein